MSNSTSYLEGTTVVHAGWLNDVNQYVFNGTIPTGSNVAPSGANQFLVSTSTTSFAWQSTLPTIGLAGGGTNASLTADNGAMVYCTASAMALLPSTGIANQVVLSGNHTAPSWSTATYPSTASANTVLGTNSLNTITALGTLPSAVQNNITATGSITAGSWGGTYSTIVPLNVGGTNANLSAVTGGVTYSTASAMAFTAAGTAGQVLTGGSTPVFSTATYPITTASGTILGSSSTNAVTALSTLPSAVQGNITSTGAVASGSWGGTYTTVVPMSVGGTNANLSPSAGAMPYCTASAMALLAPGSSGQLFTGGSVPSWTTTTYPSTNAINTIMYASAANTLSSIAAANNGVMITGATGVPSWLANTVNGTLQTNNSGIVSWLANSGTAGFVYTANAGAPPSWQAIAASAVTKVNTTVASASASLATTSLGNFAYYEFVLQNILPATDGTSLWVILGTGAGPTYHTAGTDYKYAYGTQLDGATSASAGSSGAAQIVVSDTIGGTTTRGISGFIRVYNPTITTAFTRVTWHLSRTDSSGNLREDHGSGVYTTSGTAVTAVKIQMAAGNITSGQITCLSYAQ